MTKTHIKIFDGPPGTGKTRKLIDTLEFELANGVEPNKIAFCSFTKRAIEEAIDRAITRFDFKKTDLSFFRTVHALAFQALGLRKDQVIQKRDYKKIGEHLSLTFSSKYDDISDGSPIIKNAGDQYMFIDSYSRAKHLSARDVWNSINPDGLNWYEFKRYQDTVTEYKRNKNLVDFADMLAMQSRIIPVDVLIIDEAQDLSTAQWNFLMPTIRQAKRVYIGGDDDQAIFQWSGADVNYFMNIEGERETLKLSYRIPSAIHKLSMNIAGKIKNRVIKDYIPQNKEGEVNYWNSIDHLDLSHGTWLLLARNSYLLGELSESVKNRGVAYSVRGKSTISKSHVRAIKVFERWRKGLDLPADDIDLVNEYLPKGCKKWPDAIWHEAFTRMAPEDKEYYISLLRRNESLTKNPRINISTIHGAKGGEADHVALLTDMAYSTWDATSFDHDSEHRVWYVGATRCKETLNIILPRGRYNYNI